MNPEAEKMAQAKADHAAPTPQLVGLDAFVRLKFGAKNFDQCAGFVRWANKNQHVRETQADWENLLVRFQNRAVGG